jgi:hypothetical protein
MAIQRIKPIERHFEKLLVGGIAAATLGIVLWQIAGTTVTVKSKQGEMPVSDAYRALETEAQKLKTKMLAENPKLPDEMAALATDTGSAFDAMLKRPTIRRPELAWTPAPVTIAGVSDLKTTNLASTPLQGPKLPAAERATAKSYMATVDKAEVLAAIERVPAAAKYFPAGEPYDMGFVSIESEIDGAALRAALENDPDGPSGPIPALPRPWWERTQLLNVELVRQEREADGSWGPSAVVQGLPGRISLVEDIAAATDRTKLSELELRAAADATAEEIARPAFYRNASLGGRVVGADWLPPSELGGDDDGNSQRIAVSRRLTREMDARDKARNAIERLRRQQTDQNRQPAAGPGDGGFGGRGAGRGAGGGGGGASGSPTDPLTGQINDLESKVKKHEDEIRKLEDDLKKLGGTAVKTAPKAIPADERSLSGLLRTGKFRVWAHDITAERGKAYRYSVRLKMSNPLFGRGANLAEDAKALAAQPYLMTPDGGWSEAVSLQDTTYAFFTGASTSDGGRGLSRQSATADVFVFTWGHWRVGRAIAEIGDSLVAKIDVPDVAKLAELAVAPAANPGSAPSGQPTPSGQVPFGTPTPPAATPAGGKGGPNPAAPAGAPAPGTAQPAVAVPMKQITVTKDTVLLDVNPSTDVSGTGASQKAVNQAVVRTADGVVRLRIPTRELADRMYRRMKESADDAANRMRLPGDGGGTPPPPSVRPPDDRPPPSGPAGPGPGGG